MFQRIKSYNNGSILQIYRDENNFYYYDSIQRTTINKNSSLLSGIRADISQIECATYCPPLCCDFSLLALDGSCFFTLEGDCMIANEQIVVLGPISCGDTAYGIVEGGDTAFVSFETTCSDVTLCCDNSLEANSGEDCLFSNDARCLIFND
jgi:hypothetical protein